MNLRRAHMATFPARIETLEIALTSLAPQVDEIHLVLNEYDEVPAFLAKFGNVNPVLRGEDFKDVGKFVPRPAPDDFVFLVDDDLQYHQRYCDWMIERASEIGADKFVIGLHGSIYQVFGEHTSRKRKLFYYSKSLRQSVCVDELGTGTVLALGKNVAPLEYMASSQKFVDVRFAKWCFENGLQQVAVARPRKLIRTIRNSGPSIYRTFTRNNPPVIFDEMTEYVGKSRQLGQKIGKQIGFLERINLRGR
ncbi:MAG: hypothetical protein JKY31_07225 [Rhodobacteraceae bacterium]|nr:hypothetical protein [Paracoccaceae bacterium]